MNIPDFRFHQPESIKEAIALVKRSTDGSFIAGGTDLLVEIKKGLKSHSDIISLNGIKVLNQIAEDARNIYIGSTATHNNIINSALVRKHFPSLVNALSRIGSEQIRNTGTIGGNLCTGASCCDSAPVLMVLNAMVEISSSDSVKTVPLKDFFVFNKKTILIKGELVTKIIIPKTTQGTGVHFEKFGLRNAASISVVSVAVMVKSDRNYCIDACVVIGAVAPTPRISGKATDILKGKKISELYPNSVILKEAGQAASDDAIPIDDIRGGVQYRRELLKVLTERAVVKAVEKAEGK
ncbi:MAG: xanthine dehydrogenase family protein subunit M [Bacteroidetes bacterium]|nr:xanthine dehydrogenase family protein subunit M [Bacteroidota bacterium]